MISFRAEDVVESYAQRLPRHRPRPSLPPRWPSRASNPRSRWLRIRSGRRTIRNRSWRRQTTKRTPRFWRLTRQVAHGAEFDSCERALWKRRVGSPNAVFDNKGFVPTIQRHFRYLPEISVRTMHSKWSAPTRIHCIYLMYRVKERVQGSFWTFFWSAVCRKGRM